MIPFVTIFAPRLEVNPIAVHVYKIPRVTLCATDVLSYDVSGRRGKVYRRTILLCSNDLLLSTTTTQMRRAWPVHDYSATLRGELTKTRVRALAVKIYSGWIWWDLF